MSMERPEGRGAIETEKMKAQGLNGKPVSSSALSYSILSNKSKKAKTTSTTLY